ncbi:MAG: hypothetical protein WCH65_01405 [bacterium]
MKENEQKIHNAWYWENITIPAMKKILNICKASDRFLDLEATQENFLEVMKYIKSWEEKNPMIKNQIAKDVELLKNYELKAA